MHSTKIPWPFSSTKVYEAPINGCRLNFQCLTCIQCVVLRTNPNCEPCFIPFQSIVVLLQQAVKSPLITGVHLYLLFILRLERTCTMGSWDVVERLCVPLLKDLTFQWDFLYSANFIPFQPKCDLRTTFSEGRLSDTSPPRLQKLSHWIALSEEHTYSMCVVGCK